MNGLIDAAHEANDSYGRSPWELFTANDLTFSQCRSTTTKWFEFYSEAFAVHSLPLFLSRLISPSTERIRRQKASRTELSAGTAGCKR